MKVRALHMKACDLHMYPYVSGTIHVTASALFLPFSISLKHGEWLASIYLSSQRDHFYLTSKKSCLCHQELISVCCRQNCNRTRPVSIVKNEKLKKVSAVFGYNR